MADEPRREQEGSRDDELPARLALAEQQLTETRDELERTRASRDALVKQALGLSGAEQLPPRASGRGARLAVLGARCIGLLVAVALLTQRLHRLSRDARKGRDAVSVAASGQQGPHAGQPRCADECGDQRIAEIPVPRLDWVGRTALSPSGHLAAIAGGDGRVLLLRISDGKVLTELRGHRKAVRAVLFSADGQRVITGGADGAVRVHSLKGRPLRVIRAGGAPIRDLALGRLFLAVAADQPQIEIHALAGGKPRKLSGHSGWVRAVALTRDDQLLASGGEDEAIRLWNPASGRPVDGFPGHSQWINALAFSPDGKLLAVAGFDRRVWLWDLPRRQPLHRLWGHVQRVTSLSFDDTGELLASAGLDRKIVVWDARRGSHRYVLEGHGRQVSSVSFGPKGRFLLSSSGDGTLRFWPMPPPTSPSRLPLPPPGPGELTLRGNTSGQRARIRVVDARGAVLEEGRRQLAQILRSGPDDQTLLPEPELVQLLYQISSHFGRHREVLVISGYRSPRFNRLRTRQSREVGEKSLHVSGKAIDLRIDGVAITSLHRYARKLRRGGVGFYPDSNFVHIDIGPVRYWGGD